MMKHLMGVLLLCLLLLAGCGGLEASAPSQPEEEVDYPPPPHQPNDLFQLIREYGGTGEEALLRLSLKKNRVSVPLCNLPNLYKEWLLFSKVSTDSPTDQGQSFVRHLPLDLFEEYPISWEPCAILDLGPVETTRTFFFTTDPVVDDAYFYGTHLADPRDQFSGDEIRWVERNGQGVWSGIYRPAEGRMLFPRLVWDGGYLLWYESDAVQGQAPWDAIQGGKADLMRLDCATGEAEVLAAGVVLYSPHLEPVAREGVVCYSLRTEEGYLLRAVDIAGGETLLERLVPDLPADLFYDGTWLGWTHANAGDLEDRVFLFHIPTGEERAVSSLRGADLEVYLERYILNVSNHALVVYDLEKEAQDLLVLPWFAFDPPTGRGVFQAVPRKGAGSGSGEQFFLYLQLAKGPAA